MYNRFIVKYLTFNRNDFEILYQFLIYTVIIIVVTFIVRKIRICLFNDFFMKDTNSNSNLCPVKTFNTEECPICMSKLSKEIKTNCGHVFCGLCYKQFFNITKESPNRYKCPLCRCTVSRIKRLFKNVTKTNSTNEDQNIKEFLKKYHHQYKQFKKESRKFVPEMKNIFIIIFFLSALLYPFLKNIIKRFYYELYLIQNVNSNSTEFSNDVPEEALLNTLM